MLHKSKYLQGASLATINHLSLYAGNFITYVLLVRSLSLEALGIWGIFITWITISDQVRHGFIHNGFIRLYKFSTDTQIKTLATAFHLNAIISMLLSFIMAFAIIIWTYIHPSDLISYPILWFPLALLPLAITQILNSITIAQNRLKKQFRINAVYTILTVILAAILYINNQLDIESLLITQSSVSLLILIPELFKSRVSLRYFDLGIAKELLSFGKYSAKTNVLSLLFHKADIILLSLFCGPASIAIYHFAGKIINYIEIPLNGLSQFIYPKLAEQFSSKNLKEAQKTFSNGFILMQLSVLPVLLLAILYPQVFPWLFGAEELESANLIIRILAIATIIKPLGRVFEMSLDALGKPRLNMWQLVFSLVCNGVLNIILIPIWNELGAAIATTISIYITIIGAQLIVKRQVIELQDIKFITLNINDLLNTIKLRLSWN